MIDIRDYTDRFVFVSFSIGGIELHDIQKMIFKELGKWEHIKSISIDSNHNSQLVLELPVQVIPEVVAYFCAHNLAVYEVRHMG